MLIAVDMLTNSQNSQLELTRLRLPVKTQHDSTQGSLERSRSVKQQLLKLIDSQPEPDYPSKLVS